MCCTPLTVRSVLVAAVVLVVLALGARAVATVGDQETARYVSRRATWRCAAAIMVRRRCRSL